MIFVYFQTYTWSRFIVEAGEKKHVSQRFKEEMNKKYVPICLCGFINKWEDFKSFSVEASLALWSSSQQKHIHVTTRQIYPVLEL